MTIRCILFDRDGTLGGLQDVRYPETFTPYADIRACFLKIKRTGRKVGIITNQASIARGTGANYDFNAEFASYGADVWEICPHDTKDNCSCRKPKSGMLFAVAKKLNLSPAEILVVGDRMSDVLCAKNAGSNAVLVSTQTQQHEIDEVKTRFPDVPVIARFDEVLTLLEKTDL